MSRAVVIWPESGRPDALRKVVERMPIWRALAVIMAAKLSSLPPRYSAIAAATSFADLVTTARIAVSTSTLPPRLKPIFVGGRERA